MLLEKKIFALISMLCLAGLSAALVSQHIFGLLPCAWCVLQRLIYSVIGLIAAMLTFTPYKRWSTLPAGLVILALSFAGIAAAWYQTHFAAKTFSCRLGFADKLISSSGLDEVFPWFFGIYASCADAVDRVLGLDYSDWSLILFGLLGVLATVITVRSFNKRAIR